MGSLPEKAGKALVSFPQMSIAAPRIKILAPIVIIIRLSGFAFCRGLIARRSKQTPTIVEIATARTIAGMIDSFKTVKKNRQYASEHHKLALREIYDTGGIINHGKTKPNQGINGAVRKTG